MSSDPLAQAQPQAAAGVLETSDFSSLLQKEFKPKSDRAKEAVEEAVQDPRPAGAGRHGHRLRRRDQDDPVDHRRDRQEADRADQPDHAPRRISSRWKASWRGLHYLVNNTETDEMLKIRVFNISQEGARQDAEEVQGNRLGSKPDLQEDVRRGIRAVRRRALWLPHRRLSFRSQPARCRNPGRNGEDRRRGPCPVHHRRGSPTIMQMDSWQELCESPRPDQDLPDGRIRPLAIAPRVGRCPLHRPGHAAVPLALALRRQDRSRSRSSISRKTSKGPTTASTPGRTPPMRWA